MGLSIRFSWLGAVAGMLLLAGGCSTLTPKEPHIAFETVSQPILFAANYSGITQSEADALSAYLSSFSPTAVQQVAVAVHDMSGLSVARARNVRNFLVSHGIEKSLIRLQPLKSLEPNTLVLTVEYARGIPPAPCPDWSKNSIVDYESQGSSNFGCAYGNDFIRQLADPADYIGGHGSPVSDAARDGVVIQKYMSDTPQSGGSSASSGSSGSAGSTTTTTTSTP